MFLNNINVVLCGEQGDYYGATIAWATKVEKNHIVISVPQLAALASAIEKQQRFSVNVLSENQERIARQYGGRKQSNPLSVDENDLDFSTWKLPIVINARAQYLCDLYQMDVLQEQCVITGSIVDSMMNPALPPLIYEHDKYFHH